MNLERILKHVNNPERAYEYLRDRYHPYNLVENISLAFTSRFPIGTHVLSREWDLLIILDTCRVDAMQAVAPEYEFITEVDKIWSHGGSSPDWIAHTFNREYGDTLQNTAYLTANPHAETVLDDQQYVPEKHSAAAARFYRYGKWDQVRPSDLGRFERIWKYETSEEMDALGGYIPPRVVTDRAIDVARNYDCERIVLHYMQPHYPYVSNALETGRDLYPHEKRPRYVKNEGKERVYQAYLDDLRYVLDDIKLLLNNVDAKQVVLSADHGDAFGEYRMFGHNPGRIHPHVRYVPWVETSATDSESYTPNTEAIEQPSRSTEQQLRALGYLD